MGNTQFSQYENANENSHIKIKHFYYWDWPGRNRFYCNGYFYLNIALF